MFEKSYLIRGFYQWASDSDYTIEILLWIKHPSFNNQIPEKYLNIDEEEGLLLNISRNCIKDLEIGKEKIEFSASFEGKMYPISMDIESIYWLRAREVDEYLMLDDDPPYVKGFVKNVREEEKHRQETKNRRVGMDPEDIQQWIVDNSAQYVELMHIQDWRIKYKVIRQDDPDSINNQNLSKEEGFRSGDCQTEYQYKNATIRIFASQVHTIERLRKLVVHELAHVATACFELYTKYFEKEGLYLTSQKEVARKIEDDIYELLAIQIETIVLGKETNTIGVYDSLIDSEEKFIKRCHETRVIDRKKIIVEGNKYRTSALEILEQEKKYDPDFWYSKYTEASELSSKKRDQETTENQKQILHDEYLLNKKRRERELILPVNFKKEEEKDMLEERYWKKIIFPNYIGGNKINKNDNAKVVALFKNKNTTLKNGLSILDNTEKKLKGVKSN
jgi:stringent starvation protein B